MPPNYGPTISIDGPIPSPPALTLVNAARTVVEPDDRWMNGATVWPFPRDLPDVFDYCQASSSAGHTKDAGTPTSIISETWGAYDVLEGITCTTGAFANEVDEWKRRVTLALEAYEHWAIEREFWNGALMPLNPRLAQATGLTFDGQVTPGTTNIRNGVALLEQAIADKGGNGVIHMRPAVFSQFAESNANLLVERGVARTAQGTIVVPGVGYTGQGTAQAGLATTVEFMYATGQIDVRKSGIKVLPDSIREATLRGQNLTTFRAEREVLVTWDQRIHAVVKIDRAFTTFTS